MNNRIKDAKKNLDLSKITNLDKEFTQSHITSDFTVKMMNGDVKGYQEYYGLTNKQSVAFSSKVAANRATLRAIEESENAKKV